MCETLKPSASHPKHLDQSNSCRGLDTHLQCHIKSKKIRKCYTGNRKQKKRIKLQSRNQKGFYISNKKWSTEQLIMILDLV